MSIRRSVQDFIASIGAQTNAAGTVVYVATLIAADGNSVKITRNGVTIYNKVYWNDGVSSAGTDANIGFARGSADSVTILNNDGTISKGDAQQFIQSLV